MMSLLHYRNTLLNFFSAEGVAPELAIRCGEILRRGKAINVEHERTGHIEEDHIEPVDELHGFH